MCTNALRELKPKVEAIADQGRPIAAGGCPEGDAGLLANLLVQPVLVEAGWKVITDFAAGRVAVVSV